METPALTNDRLIEILSGFPKGTPVRIQDSEVPIVTYPLLEHHVNLADFIGEAFKPPIKTIVIG